MKCHNSTVPADNKADTVRRAFGDLKDKDIAGGRQTAESKVSLS